MKSVLLNGISKKELTIGLIASLWIYAFLVLIGPFDVAMVGFTNRILMMLGYPIIFFLTYLSSIPLQNRIKSSFKNRLSLELILAVYLLLAMLLPSYLYYKSDFILGEFSFFFFFFQMYLPILLLVLSILFLVRRLLKKGKQEKVTISGIGNYDMLKLEYSNLVFVKSSNNYVEVNYLENGTLKTKLIRTSLKKVKQNYPDLLQTHRSYLINKQHFIAWNTRKNIVLTQAKVPVSDTFRSEVQKLNPFRHK